MAHALIYPRPPGDVAERDGRSGWFVRFGEASAKVPFPSMEAAIGFCAREGHDFDVIPPPRRH